MNRTLSFDIESTGLSTETGRIVSLCMKPSDTGEEYYTLVNPTISIPVESTEVHGIRDEDVTDAPTFRDILPKIEELINGANVLHAYNGSRFDAYILQAELSRAESQVSVLRKPLLDNFRLWQEAEPRTLEDASLRFTGKEIDGSHNASADVNAMIEVDAAMKKEFGYDGKTDLELAAMLKGDKVTPDGKFVWKDDRVTMNWGKPYFGWPLIDAILHNPGYFHFVLGKDGDWLNHGVKATCLKAIELCNDEAAFTAWTESEFGPAPTQDNDTDASKANPCPSCGGPTHLELIYAGDPQDPDVVDVEVICPNCDINGYYEGEWF